MSTGEFSYLLENLVIYLYANLLGSGGKIKFGVAF